MKWSAISAHSGIVLLLSISSLVNVGLVLKLKSQQSYIDYLKQDGNLRINAIVPSIKAMSSDGHPVTIRFDDASVPTVLYVMSPSCGWCKKNQANIAALVTKTGCTVPFRWAFAVLGWLASIYRSRVSPPYQIFSQLEPATLTTYRLGATPETIVISPLGKVLRIWKGAFSADILPDVQSYFGVSLPGLAKN